MNAAWFIAKKDVGYMLRQKETLLWVFVMPIVFFYFMGSVGGGGGVGPPSDEDPPDPIAVRASADDGFVLDELEHRLEEQNYAVKRFVSDEGFDAFERRLSVPQVEGSTFTERVLAGEKQVLTFTRRGEGTGTDFDQVRVSQAVYRLLADLVVVASEGGEATPQDFTRLAEMPRALTLRVEPAGRRETPPSGYEQTIPGTMVMFTMLVLLTSGAILLVIEREQGLLRRLASTPIPRRSVVLGKWMGKMALGLVQIAFAMLAGTVLFGMDWGSSVPMVGLLLFAWAAFNASFGILLANLARSEGQMAGLGILCALLFAALGGCWWPIEITPGWMQGLQLFIPTGWVMDAMHQLVSFGYGAASALPHVAITSAAALTCGWLGVRTFRYQ